MKTEFLKTNCALVLAVSGFLAAGTALADKPNWAGADKGGKHSNADSHKGQKSERRHDQKSDRRDDQRSEQRERQGRSSPQRGHFEDRQRVFVRDYYEKDYRAGRCPPGLAKKHNGCMPPGQAKKWHYGQPLAREVIYYEVPRPLVLEIGVPPSGYRYVRVATDILLIAIGTGMVVDAMENLGRM